MIEKIFFQNKKKLKISGVLCKTKSHNPLLIFAHGFAGNKDENGLFVEAEQYFSKKGYNTFRFDFEGAGESEGEFQYATLQNQADDLEFAVSFINSTYAKNKIGLVGFSLGATAALIKSPPRVDAYCLWSPALFPSKDMFPRYNNEEIMLELKNKGFIPKAGLKVGSRIIEELRTCDLTQKMNGLQKPVLLVHGTKDPRINYERTKKAKEYFKYADLELIAGANHSYKENNKHRMELFSKTSDWLEKH